MQSCTFPVPQMNSRIKPRTALVASADPSFRQRVSDTLTGLRWNVRAAEGGAHAWAETFSAIPEAVIVDNWLPDLDIGEFLREFTSSFPYVDVIGADGHAASSIRGPHRQELLYALRSAQETDTAAWNTAPSEGISHPAHIQQPRKLIQLTRLHTDNEQEIGKVALSEPTASTLAVSGLAPCSTAKREVPTACDRLPELIGDASRMLEVSRRIRLVAPRKTSVLIEGPTGSGKELVAQALHRLSPRNRKAFVAINCAAIPEALLEAELFGHTRGAFTGAVKGRVGRIEAADGGTLFLDEIGEMPLALQSKLLRFVESGELQRVGENEPVRVDVRIIAATHQPLAQQTQQGKFRPDLYYRLAVFLVHTPPLADHAEDIPLLVNHFLEELGRDTPIKRLDSSAMSRLVAHTWPGNVRELQHVLERAAILAGDEPTITAQEIEFETIVH